MMNSPVIWWWRTSYRKKKGAELIGGGRLADESGILHVASLRAEEYPYKIPAHCIDVFSREPPGQGMGSYHREIEDQFRE
jgi:hypothetical protein